MVMRRPPLYIPITGYLLQLLAFEWDTLWHTRNLRESFWTPSHLGVYLGVMLVFASGLIPIVVNRGRVPLGQYVLGFSGLAQLSMAPVDDLWHRLYGIDNTLWSFPHLVFMLGGAVSVLGVILLLPTASAANSVGTGGSGQSAPGLSNTQRLLGWSGPSLLREPSLPLFGLFLSGIDLTLLEFELNIPPPFWPWDFALYPPLIIGAALLAGVAGLAMTGRVGAITTVCLAFTLLQSVINLELAALRFRTLPTIPLLLPGAVVADLLVLALARVPLPPRVVLASSAFGVIFYVVQPFYTAVFPLPDPIQYTSLSTVAHWFDPPPWTAAMIHRSWPFALILTPLAASAGLLLGQAMRASRVAAPRWTMGIQRLTGKYSRETRLETARRPS
jgi:hypothetical protein